MCLISRAELQTKTSIYPKEAIGHSKGCVKTNTPSLGLANILLRCYTRLSLKDDGQDKIQTCQMFEFLGLGGFWVLGSGFWVLGLGYRV